MADPLKVIVRRASKNEEIYRDKHYDHYSFSLLKRDWNGEFNKFR